MYSEFFEIQKIKNGDADACEIFIKKYYASIYQYCLLHIHDTYYAEDITQETFMRFFKSLETYTVRRKLKGYLYCIAGNIIKDYYKKKKAIPIATFPEIPNQPMADMELRWDIETAIDHLPEELKEIAILFFFQELKQREIADLLGIKLSLVKYRISRVKQFLEESLEVNEK